jgi:bis(5'-nucleosyl)-tetraphosphatase (symmetrical)
MSDYAIGDVHGCYEPLMRLLDYVQFDDNNDRLWFVGDLVNRGPQSLDVLRLIKNLKIPARITLGNHDLHLLTNLFGRQKNIYNDDTIDSIINAHDSEELGHWLRKQPLLYHDKALNVVMCHAGIAPIWNLSAAKQYALEVETALAGDNYHDYLDNIYSNDSCCWSPKLTHWVRLRVITNYFTRMRFCRTDGCLALTYKGKPAQAPNDVLPWYEVANRPFIEADIIFGHWSALQGVCPIPTIHAIDTGCLWGKQLTAIRLQDRALFSVLGLKS